MQHRNETIMVPIRKGARHDHDHHAQRQHVAAARAVRKTLKTGAFKPEDIDRFKRAGRA
jgi:serine/threonine protein kinase HipA of HipAB toxin-antitoxin module